MGARQFGARVARVEDPALLAGRARFVDDIRLPGMLHGCFVRSPHPHARVRAIDTAAALAMPGVHAVLTARDMPGRLASEPLPTPVPNPAITALRTQRALAGEEVCYAGEAIALVVAENRYAAEDAAAAVAVDFERLDAVSDCRDGLAAGGMRAHSDLATNVAGVLQMSYGDVDAAFAGAAHVFAEEIFQHRGAAMTLETRAVLASHNPVSDVLTVWSATQTPHLCQRTIADLLERELPSVRVIAPFVGGGFGTKAPFYSEEIVVPVAAMKLGRPVKWIEDRREHFLSATMERDQYWTVAIAVDRDGRILGLRGAMIHDSGAYLPWGIIAPYIATTTFPGPYVVPAFRFETTVVLTNRVPTTVVRGAGRPQAVFAMERLMDRVARELAIDRAELRRRNMIAPQQMPYRVGLMFRDGKPLVYASGDFPRSQARAIALSDYNGFRDRQKSARAEGRYIGIGIANYVEGTGLGPFEGVTVRLLPSGRVAVATGATTQGQGTHTMLSQIVADRLGCRIGDVVVTAGDTNAISQGIGAFASRQAINAGSSASIAAENVRAQVVALAAQTLGVAETEIDIEEGRAIAQGGNKPILTFGELARLAQGMPGFSLSPGQKPGLEHTAYFTPPQASYCNGTHVAEVEVDPMTGGVTILSYVVAHDSGNVINPMIVDGQVQGGVAHGIGNALFEFMKYDADAQPLTTTFADYLLPAAGDVPACVIEHVETPNPLNPLGVKGAGEGGAIPAPAAIVAAIEDALSPFGVHFAEMPLTPDRIVATLKAAGAYEKL
ncbi:MAG TPA: xanthine dehydrogenase family protein molybdopterin-binding subunit [Xanthobacteraceae bacterium]|jgi:carbon-monoxide dehydrogenase large subunit|nr:xanthine dehydrogenase family protein molybdopterin-binding subunit [Xanthobacteraceae bacterium]